MTVTSDLAYPDVPMGPMVDSERVIREAGLAGSPDSNSIKDTPNTPYPNEQTQPFFRRTGVGFADLNGDGLVDMIYSCADREGDEQREGTLNPTDHFIDGMMIPRRMIFWQKMNSNRVGMEASTSAAMNIQGAST